MKPQSQAVPGATEGVGLPVQGPRRRRALRVLVRVALALGGVLVVAVGTLLFGWRYGFRPLPPIEAGVTVDNPHALSVTQLKPDHAWYWAMQMQSVPDPVTYGNGPLEVFVRTYVETGLSQVTNAAEVAQWLADQPILGTSFTQALAAPNCAAVSHSELKEYDVRWGSYTFRDRLSQFALWRAAEAERTGAIVEAYDHLLAGLRLSYRLRPDTLPVGSDDLAAVWRRLALRGPLPPRAEAIRLLTTLDELRRESPSLELVFRRRSWTRFEGALAECSDPDQRQHEPALNLVASAFRRAFEDAVQYLGWILFKAMRSSDSPPYFANWKTLAEPLGPVCVGVVQSVLRTNDLARMYQAYVGGVVARLRSGQTNAAIAWAAEMRRPVDVGSPWTWVDRPLVWRFPAQLEPLADCLQCLQGRELQLEACRVTLALRLYHDTYHHWPDQLSELVPEFLPQNPTDPFSGQPFLYRTLEGQGYVFASIGLNDHPPGWLLSTNRFYEPISGYYRQVFFATEPEVALTRWKSNSVPANSMNLRLLMRYGLLPGGTTIRPAVVAPRGAGTGSGSIPPAP